MLISSIVLITVTVFTFILYIRKISNRIPICLGIGGLLTAPLFDLIDPISKYQDTFVLVVFMILISGVLLASMDMRRGS